ncbi:hypothetical protein [Streptosporangium sp. NPDC001681]|uniref:hypothetical protein n=1 Tax=Streptosporangium sp. NPDC001681 TaxID=3154395 RepID=UPI00331B03D3
MSSPVETVARTAIAASAAIARGELSPAESWLNAYATVTAGEARAWVSALAADGPHGRAADPAAVFSQRPPES